MLNSLEYCITFISVLQDAGARILSFSQGLSLTCHLETNLPGTDPAKMPRARRNVASRYLVLEFSLQFVMFSKNYLGEKNKKMPPGYSRMYSSKRASLSCVQNRCAFRFKQSMFFSGVDAGKGPCAVFIFSVLCVLLVVCDCEPGGGVWGGKGGMLTFFATARFSGTSTHTSRYATARCLLHIHKYVMPRCCKFLLHIHTYIILRYC